MRILILSNFFPPSRSWGYTQLCEEVVAGLRARGHHVEVLTSNYDRDKVSAPETWIHRDLHLETDPYFYQPFTFLTRYRRQVRENELAFKKVVELARPDVVFVWGMWNMSKRIPALAEALQGVKVAYYLADLWPAMDSPHQTYWRLPTRRAYLQPFRRLGVWLADRILALHEIPPLKYEHVICVSNTLRENLVKKGVPVHQAQTIYNGIDVNQFNRLPRPNRAPAPDGGLVKALFAGRLTHDKGAHTAVESMNILVNECKIAGMTLTVVGDGVASYKQQLMDMVAQNGLQNVVFFEDRVEREEMPALLRRFDVLVFPSIADEALPRMPQEAMACGMVVVGTTTGGTQELLIEGQTGLTFPPGDARALASQLARLASEPELRARLVEAGYQAVMENFTIQKTIHRIETYLDRLLKQG